MKKSFKAKVILFISFIFVGCSNRIKANDLYHKALDAYVNGRFDECYSICKQIENYDSGMDKAMFLEAKAGYFLGNNMKACEILERLNYEKKGYTDASLYYVHGLLDLGKVSEANEVLENLLEWNQNDYRLWYLKSIAARELGNVRERIGCLKQAELCLMDCAKVYSEMSMLYRSLDMIKTADAYESKAVAFARGDQIANE